MNSASAFAPGNISCIFVIRRAKSPEKSGSLGVGFTVNKGVTVTIKKARNGKHNKKTFKKNKKRNVIYFNSKKINFPTVDSTIEKLTGEKFIVDIRSELPLGSGFGLSGASALATAYAVNKLLMLKKPKRELAMVAHVSEVENLTGLGDVINQYYGGVLVKYRPSYMFRAEKLPIKNKEIYYRHFSRLDTKKIISDERIKSRINMAGLKALEKIRKIGRKADLENIIAISKDFAAESGLLKSRKLKSTIGNIEKKDGNASMIMLGNSVFSDKKFKGSKKLIISNKGAHFI